MERLDAVTGGLHLGGPVFEPLTLPEPELIVTTHCTGWRPIQKLAATFPDTFVPGCVGTRFTL